MEIIIGAIYKDLDEPDYLFTIVNSFKSEQHRTLYIKQYSAKLGHSPEALAKWNPNYYDVISKMNLDKRYTYHFGGISSYSNYVLVSKTVKATRLALKMYPDAVKSDCGGVIYV